MARVVMEEGTARLAGWDLTADDDEVWGLGLGCNGAIEVFIEPAERAAAVTHALRAALEEERPICVVTALESEAPDRVTPGTLARRPDGPPRDRSVTPTSTRRPPPARTSNSPQAAPRSALSPAASARSSRCSSHRCDW